MKSVEQLEREGVPIVDCFNMPLKEGVEQLFLFQARVRHARDVALSSRSLIA
jgi:hypothetical protein